MTIDEMIESLQAIRKIHGGSINMGASVDNQITLGISVTAPPVKVQTIDGLETVAILAIVKNGD